MMYHLDLMYYTICRMMYEAHKRGIYKSVDDWHCFSLTLDIVRDLFLHMSRYCVSWPKIEATEIFLADW